MEKPRMPLNKVENQMLKGMTLAAWLISSAIKDEFLASVLVLIYKHTNVVSAIISYERTNRCNPSNKKRNTHAIPSTQVLESGKDLVSGNKHSNKSQDINNKHHSFDTRKKTTQISIDEDTKESDGIEKQSRLPQFRIIVWIVENQETLDQRSDSIACFCNKGLPTNHGEPSCQVAKKLLAPRRRQNSNPIKGATGERNPISGE
ncbi:hypothetical protein BTUL_0193g00100 [Botrytis tulipae]|uniref:Uncharacterized protein n=1 Tax=Botrytis tulipae TaxID=87230 RepID=A0A4Z1EEF2_9HELO|nr:hypothetical protein BTUL_0193g00100 [Botrytis tulipae]